MLGFVGNSSLLDCAVNQKFYEERDIYVILAGVPRECFTTPNVAAVNMGPYYSALGAAQYLVRQEVKCSSPCRGQAARRGLEHNEGVLELAKQEGIPGKSFLEPVPVTDGAAIALKLAEAAGDGGGVVIIAVAPEALKVLQGAEQQGLIDKVKWGCATPCNDASLSEAVGPAWNDKLFINAELNLVDTDGPDMQLYRQVNKKYAPDVPQGSSARWASWTRRSRPRPSWTPRATEFTQKTVNEAFRDIKPFKTDILCKPWYFGRRAVPVRTTPTTRSSRRTTSS